MDRDSEKNQTRCLSEYDGILECDSKVEKCKSIIEKTIGELRDKGIYSMPDRSADDESDILVRMDLISVGDLSHEGILSITVTVTVSWVNNRLRWDENRTDCNKTTVSCRTFIDRTEQYDMFVTKASNTKIYDFKLVNDTTTDMLSKKMAGYPLIVHKNGSVEWEGVLHLVVKCPLEDVDDYPFDAQMCRLRWKMIPRPRHGMRVTFAGRPLNATSVNWRVLSFFYFNETGNETGAFQLDLERISLNAMATIVIPFLCFNALIGLVYVLPAGSGERVGYSVTLVLSFSVLLMGISKIVPSSPGGQLNIGERVKIIKSSAV